MNNRIINRIDNMILINNLFLKIGFNNIHIYNKNIKIASVIINSSTDKSYVIKEINKINSNFNDFNLLLKLLSDTNKYDQIFYEYKQPCIQCEATKQYTNNSYFLSSHICKLYISNNITCRNLIKETTRLQYYIIHPFLWIANCYQLINNNYNYIETKIIFLTKEEHAAYFINNKNLAKYFNLQNIM